MKTRILSLLLALALLCAVLPQFTLSARAEEVYSGACGEHLTWSFDPDTNTLTIEGFGPMDDSYAYVGQPWYRFHDRITSVVLPDGLTALAEHAFEGLGRLDTVRLPESLTSIPDGAFFDCGLKELELPKTVTSIGRYAFKNCIHLRTIQIPEGVTEILFETFYNCNCLESITLPSTLNYIGENAFRDCISLTEVPFPEQLSFIGAYAFYGCDNLWKADFPAGLRQIDERAFSGCAKLTEVTFSEGLECIGPNAFADCTGLEALSFPATLRIVKGGAFWRCTGLKNVTFQEGLHTIEGFAFSECCSLQTLALPEGLTSVGEQAFSECVALTEISLPASLTDIGEMAFSHCAATPAIRVAAENPNYCSDEAGVLYNKEKTMLIQYPCGRKGSYEIPEGVTTIGFCSFGFSEGLSDVTFPESLTGIETDAFWGCTALTALSLPEQLVSIEQYAFYGCSSLTDVTFQEGLTNIGLRAFEGCLSLTSVTLPKSLKNIGNYAFGFWFNYLALWDTPIEGFTVYGYTGTGAAAYAKEKNIHFVALNNPFADVKQGKYYYDAVQWAYNHDPQITSGIDDTHFGPNKTCTRGEVMTFLWSAMQKPEADWKSNPFMDVSKKKFYFKPVLWAFQNGVTKGADETHFNPNGDCTRAQVVTFLWAASGRPEPEHMEQQFADVGASKYYFKAVQWAAENDITRGTDDTHFSPNQTCTRAQVVTFLYKLLGGQ